MKRLDDRHEPRREADGEVRLRFLFTKNEDVEELRGELKDVSPGGLCVDPEGPVEVGALAELDLRLTGEPLKHTLGLVRWVDPDRGVGIEFFYGTDEEKRALEEYLSRWLEARDVRSDAAPSEEDDREP